MSSEIDKLFEIVDEIIEEKEEETYIVVRKVWVLSRHIEKFEVPAKTESKAVHLLASSINDEEYRKFKNETEVEEIIPYLKDYPNNVIKS